MKRWCLLLCAAAELGFSTSTSVAASKAPGDSMSTEVLGTLSRLFSDRFITGLESVRSQFDSTEYVRAGRRMYLSTDGLHMAYSIDLVTSRTMVVDGVVGKNYGWTSRGMFSREGGHFAYLAGPSEQTGSLLVLDGRELQLGVYVYGRPRLSPDGRHWAVVARSHPDTTEQAFVVTDRGTDRPYDWIGPVALSWDGAHRAYVARHWYRTVVVIDGVESPEYDEATQPVFDLSGEHVAFAYRAGSSWHVVQDGTASESYGWLDPNSLRFSANGQRLAYVASYLHAEQRLFIDGEPRLQWSGVVTDTSLFSPDGEHTLFWGQDYGLYVPVLDDSALASPGTNKPGDLVFSADSRHFAYSEGIQGTSQMHVVLDGVPGPEFDWVGRPHIDDAGRHIAYRASRGGRQMLVLDGVVKYEVSVVGNPVFDRSGEHEAYFAWLSSGHAVVYVDGRQGPEFDWVSSNGPTFLDDGRLQFLAVRNSVLMRVTQVPRTVE